jgi:hypothetical protein
MKHHSNFKRDTLSKQAAVAANFQIHLATKYKISSRGSFNDRNASHIDLITIICTKCNIANTVTASQCFQCGFNLVPDNHRSNNNFDWGQIEELCFKRKDYLCPICIMPFKCRNELVLSCTHIFHAPCLKSFEKYTANHQKLCPVCRGSNYSCHETHIGSEAYCWRSATTIQSIIRKWLVRIRYLKILRSYYQAGHGTSSRRQKFYQQEFRLHNNRMMHENDEINQEIDQLIK